MIYNSNEFSSFIVCGEDRFGKRFRITSLSWFHAYHINLWIGNVYGILKTTGKRVKLKSVVN